MKHPSTVLNTLAAGLLLAAAALPAQAHRRAGPSDAGAALSTLSALPLVLSVAVPVAALASGAAFTVVAITAVGETTVWLLRRASDGLQFSVTLAAASLGGAALTVGTTVTAVACSSGWILSSAGRAVGFLPNPAGRDLLFNERVTQ